MMTDEQIIKVANEVMNGSERLYKSLWEDMPEGEREHNIDSAKKHTVNLVCDFVGEAILNRALHELEGDKVTKGRR